jgi:hypothetical protein
MNKIYTFLALVASTFLLVSFSANPPDGKTGAPGESLCAECHSPANAQLNGEITVEGFPAVISPGEDYTLTVVNRNTVGDAVRGGFQMTILGPFNTKAGEMTDPSANSTVTQTLGGRQYFEHNPAVLYPDSNVIKWTVQWRAPDIAAGSEITYYVAGNIANGNFQSTGDRIVTSNGKGTVVLSATEDLSLQKPTLYPNPGSDRISIVLADGTLPDGIGIFYSLTGTRAGEAEIQHGQMNTPDLVSGVYVVEIRQGEKSHFVRWSKI